MKVGEEKELLCSYCYDQKYIPEPRWDDNDYYDDYDPTEDKDKYI